MGKLTELLVDLSDIECNRNSNDLIRQLDPRVKILLTAVFIITVVSFDRYELLPLLPCFAYPLFIIIIADIPLLPLLKKLLLVSIFAFMLGIVNPFFDRQPMLQIGTVTLSGGWVSFISIMLKFTLTASSALLLLITTGMYQLSRGLEALGLPQALVMQLFFLSRYIFVIADELNRMDRARLARSSGHSTRSARVFSQMLSTLFMRSFDRAENIYTAMRCREYNGSMRGLRQLHWQSRDSIFLISWLIIFFIFYNSWLVNAGLFVGDKL